MDHFRTLPWFKTLMEKPGFVAFNPITRDDENASKDEPPRNQLFRQVLNNEEAIPHCTGFYMKDDVTHSEGQRSDGTSASSAIANGSKLRLQIRSCSLVYDLRSGVNGFNQSMQGGFFVTLMDDAMTCLIMLNADVQKNHLAENPLPTDVLQVYKRRAVTAKMDVRLHKPVYTPQVVIVTASLTKAEPRKMFFNASIRDETGDLCGTCDALFIGVPPEKI
ncbi:hypothetical protein ACHAQH_001260 [Verticillium albo-atrum]